MDETLERRVARLERSRKRVLCRQRELRRDLEHADERIVGIAQTLDRMDSDEEATGALLGTLQARLDVVVNEIAAAMRRVKRNPDRFLEAVAKARSRRGGKTKKGSA